MHEISIFADPLLPKVFANLMENTERYAVYVTRIRISCQVEKKDEHTFRDPEGNTRPILIIWEDDGVGIRDEEKEKIFERGYGKNTGLGLFFIREILGITGITISENGVYGEGARFVIRVPERGWRKEE
ncbi:MAG: Multi-sensor signal transduction histidine kinase [Methanomicrobiales archaeon 53_19]|jgi:signal transduction histidine kinase|uniref:sensor histidine kinase n=1 Tax=Methanocalculus sp. TaxID=2004547 RepID=UPI0007494684|nr:sensor histidine kinase [Methanocalculus sp.]KUL03609.1 MAG: Multi-sensor signal transduction histidine kinase [Methanomicrobiales archaeon 53_19]HIJ06243.1 sensor histidine kinase [Methanocalculus sp.]